MEIGPGIHHLPLEIEVGGNERTFHLAAVEIDRGVVLLDAGLPGTADAIAGLLDEAGHALEDLRLVLLTHHDGDHAGGLAQLLARTDPAPVVAAHERAAPYVDGREAPLKGDPEDRYPPVPVDLELVGDETVNTTAGPMRVLHTPGHAPGHLSLYFPEERLLLAADALTAADGTLQGPNPEFTLEMDEALRSAGRLADLDVRRILCYHGGMVEAGTDRIAAIADR